MKLSLEIPTPMLSRWAPRTDLDFALAHKVLEDQKYADHFSERAKGRELILDNSTHEFGTPMDTEDLKEAARRCRADYIVAPDIIWPSMSMRQYEMNIEWMKECTKSFHTKTAAVWCGITTWDRRRFLRIAKEVRVEMICFTFHIPERITWWPEFVEYGGPDFWNRVHLLGVSTLEELQAWVEIERQHPEIQFSVDTTKPVKWGMQGRKLDELESMRKGPIDAAAVLELTDFSDEQISCVEYNIELLKKICAPQVTV